MYSSFVSHRYWRFRQVLRFCQSRVLEDSPGTQNLSVTGSGGLFSHWIPARGRVSLGHCDMYATTMG